MRLRSSILHLALGAASISLSCHLGPTSHKVAWFKAVNEDIHCIEYNPLADGQTLYAGGDGKNDFWRSDDGGLTWAAKRIDSSSERLTSVKQVFCHPSDTSVLIAVVNSKGLFKSVNGGSSWKNVLPIGGALGDAIVINPISMEIYYGQYLLGPLWISIDKGDHWFNVRDSQAMVALCTTAIDPVSGEVIVGASGGSIARSKDSGRSWQFLVPMERASRFPSEVPKILIERNTRTYYATRWLSDDSALLVSKNLGKDWTSIPLPSQRAWAFEITHDEVTKQRRMWLGLFNVYHTATKESLLFWSEDNGETWEAMDFPFCTKIWSVKGAPGGGQLAVASDYGLFIHSNPKPQ